MGVRVWVRRCKSEDEVAEQIWCTGGGGQSPERKTCQGRNGEWQMGDAVFFAEMRVHVDLGVPVCLCLQGDAVFLTEMCVNFESNECSVVTQCVSVYRRL